MTAPSEMRACPHCGGALLPKALQCRHCRRWMPELVATAATPEPVPATRISSAQPPTHLAALSILTLGLYELYWFWRNWRDLRDELGVDVQPGWRTLGLLIPVVNVVLVYDQLRMLREQSDARGVPAEYSPGLVTATFFAIALAGNLTTAVAGSMTTFWPLSLLNVVPLLQVQAALNRLWAHAQPGAIMRTQLGRHEIIAMIAGTILTVAALLETFGSFAPK